MKRAQPKTLKPGGKTVPTKTAARGIEPKLPKKQGVGKPKGRPLKPVRKTPVFQLSREENPEVFDLMSFVIKVCTKDAERPFTEFLHVEQIKTGSRIVACDRFRLHVAEIPKRIKSGDYKPHLTKDLITLGEPVAKVKFPSWSKVIPEDAEKRGIIDLERSGLGKDWKESEKLTLAYSSFEKQTGEVINIRYLEDLAKQKWAVYRHPAKKIIMFKQQNSNAGEPEPMYPLAVILPIQKAA